MDYWDPSDGCCDFWSIWKSPQRFWSSRWCRRIALLLLWTYGWSKVILNKLSNETISTNIYTSNFEILKIARFNDNKPNFLYILLMLINKPIHFLPNMLILASSNLYSSLCSPLPSFLIIRYQSSHKQICWGSEVSCALNYCSHFLIDWVFIYTLLNNWLNCFCSLSKFNTLDAHLLF